MADLSLDAASALFRAPQTLSLADAQKALAQPPTEPAAEKPAVVPNTGLMGDLGSAVKGGYGSLAQGAGQVAGWVGANETKKSLQHYGKEIEEHAAQEMTPESKEAMALPWVKEKPGGWLFGHELGPAVTSPRALALAAAQSLPASVATIPATLAAPYLLPEAAIAGIGTVGASVLGRFGIAIGEKAIPKLGAQIFGALSSGSAEGLVQAGMTGQQVEETILGMSPELVAKSPLYPKYLAESGGDPAKAQAAIAKHLANEASVRTGALTAAAGAPMGAVFGSATRGYGAGKLGTAAKGVLGEAGQETVQNPLDQYVQNVAERQVDPSVSPTRKLVEQGVQGAAVGAAMGAGHGAAAGALGAHGQPAPAPAPQPQPPDALGVLKNLAEGKPAETPRADAAPPPPPAAPTGPVPPGLTPVVEGGEVQGYIDQKGGYHDADEVSAATAETSAAAPPAEPAPSAPSAPAPPVTPVAPVATAPAAAPAQPLPAVEHPVEPVDEGTAAAPPPPKRKATKKQVAEARANVGTWRPGDVLDIAGSGKWDVVSSAPAEAEGGEPTFTIRSQDSLKESTATATEFADQVAKHKVQYTIQRAGAGPTAEAAKPTTVLPAPEPEVGDQVENARQEVIAATQAYLDNPDDPAVKKRLKDAERAAKELREAPAAPAATAPAAGAEPATETFKEHIARLEAQKAKRIEAATQIAGEGDEPVVLAGPTVQGQNGPIERGMLISPSADPEYPGWWQVTRFDNDGFSGHTVEKTKVDAVASALGEGYADTNRNMLRQFAGTERFKRGNEYASMTQAQRDEFNRAEAAKRGDPNLVHMGYEGPLRKAIHKAGIANKRVTYSGSKQNRQATVRDQTPEESAAIEATLEKENAKHANRSKAAKKKPAPPGDIVHALARAGGLRDEEGWLRSQNYDTQFRPGAKGWPPKTPALIQPETGMTIDRAIEWAQEKQNAYLPAYDPDHPSTLGSAELYDAIERRVQNGDDIQAAQEAQGRREKEAARDEWVKQFESAGDARSVERAYRRGLEIDHAWAAEAAKLAADVDRAAEAGYDLPVDRIEVLTPAEWEALDAEFRESQAELAASGEDRGEPEVPGLGEGAGPPGGTLREGIAAGEDGVGGPAREGELEPPAAFQIAAWHGSPHDFDEFSTSKIGTGEGNQTYGHGLYFAGAKSLGEHYRDVLAASRGWIETPEGERIDVRDYDKLEGINERWRAEAERAGVPEGVADDLFDGFAERAFDIKKEIALHQKQIDESHAENEPAEYEEYYVKFLQHLLDSGWKQGTPKGRLYQATLAPDDHELLDWDRPLSQQSEQVQKALKEIPGTKAEGYWDGDPSGEDVYKALVDLFGSKPKASTALAEVGVPGLRYLDGDSRARLADEAWLARLQQKIAVQTAALGAWDNSPEGVRRSAITQKEIDKLKSDIEFVRKRVAERQPPSHNYVVFDDKHVAIDAKFQTAWHGSPHDFEKFSTDKIGTGEGQQVYGRGLYFASRRAVAEHYKNALGGGWFFPALGRADSKIIPDWVRNQIAAAGDKKHAIAEATKLFEGRIAEMTEAMKTSIQPWNLESNIYGLKQILATLDNLRGAATQTAEKAGRLYKVDLAPQENEYLDWDKRLSKQSDHVRSALKRLDIEPPPPAPKMEWRQRGRMAGAEHLWQYGYESQRGEFTPVATLVQKQDGAAIDIYKGAWAQRGAYQGAFMHSDLALAKKTVEGTNPAPDPEPELTGKEIYERLSRELDGAERASKALADVGVPGNRYLEGASRAAGEGMHNYVIFDEKHVSIEEKFERAMARAKDNGAPKGELVRMANHLLGRLKMREQFTDTESALANQVDAIAKKMFPKTRLRAAERLVASPESTSPGARVTGAYYAKPTGEGLAHIIAWSLESPHAAGTVRHEGIHYLRRAGAFTDAEWATLAKAAETDGWLDRYQIEKRYPNLERAKQIEEAIAEHFGNLRRDQFASLPEPIRRLFQWLDLLRRRIVAAVRDVLGKDVTADDIMTTIESGEIGQRAGEGEAVGTAQQGEAPPFFSALTRAVADIKQEKAPAAQWSNLIRNLTQRGVKQDEIDWSGVQDWLKDQKGVVTKAALLDQLRENEVQVEEVEKGGDRRVRIVDENDDEFISADAVDKMAAEWGVDALEAAGRMIDEAPDGEDLRRQRVGGSATKFGSYVLPGGERYRELLLTLPLRKNEATEREKERGYRADDDGLAIPINASTTTTAYTSSHWSEPNILAHIRVNDRTDANGKKTLFVEEIQSDWHQAGRRRGYSVPIKPVVANLDSQFGDEIAEVHRLFGDHTITKPKDVDVVIARSNALESNVNAALQAAGAQGVRLKRDAGGRWDAIQLHPDGGGNTVAHAASPDRALAAYYRTTKRGQGVPDAPLKTQWPEMAFKRVLRMAAEGGYDQVAWTTGDQQAERYDLSKHVKSIAYATEGRQKGTLQVFDHNAKLVANPTLNGDSDLADHIGKEAADKLLNSPTKKFADQYGHWHLLDGLDLRIGGEGMKGFYDKILPSIASKLGKKWGAKVGEATINGTAAEENWHTVNPDTGAQLRSPYMEVGDLDLVDRSREVNHPRFDVRNEDGVVQATFETLRAAKQYLGIGGEGAQIHSIPVTPEMRAGVMEGQPLFQKPEQPATEMTEQGEQQVMPGAEHVSPEELRRRKAARDREIIEQRMKGKARTKSGKAQSDEGLTLFGNKGEQTSMFDEPPAAKPAEPTAAPKKPVQDTLFQIHENAAQDKAALDELAAETGDRVTPEELDKARGPLWSTTSFQVAGTPDQEAIINRVLQFEGKVPLGQRIRESWTEVKKNGVAKFRQGMLDRLDAVAQLEKGLFGKLLDASVSAYKAMRMTTNLSSVMHVLLKKGMIGYQNGEFRPVAGFDGGFEGIFKPLAESGKLRLWQAWAVANRANRLIREGRENLMSQEDIDALLPLGQQHPEFARTLAKYQAFNQKILDMATQTGLLTPELRAQLRSNDYVPFYRVLDRDGSDVGGPGVKGGVSGQSAGIMRLKGGEAMINDLFHNMTRNMSRLVDASFKNMAGVRTIDLALQAGAVRKRPPDYKPVHFTASELQDALDDINIGSDVIPPAQKDLAIKLFTMVQPKDGNVVSIKRAGKTEYYEVDDPLLLAAFGPAHIKQNGLVMFGGRFSNALRRGVTTLPDFMTANFIRDTLSAWVVSGGKTNPLRAASGFVASLRDSVEAQEIAAAGGGGKGFYGAHPKDVAEQLGEDTGVSRKNFLRRAFEIWEKVGQASEQANRIAVYRALKRAGASNAEAAYQAVDLLDFGMRGDFAAQRAVTTLVPFLNARIQGLYKLWRSAKENPAGFWMRGAAIMMPSVALTMSNIGQDWYDELSPDDRELYYHFKIGGQHFRLPKPFEVGAMFSTAPELLVNSWYKTEYGRHTTQRAAAILMDQFNFNPTPQAIKPLLDQLMNQQGLVGGRPIVSHHFESLPEAQQFTPRTSTLAKMIGQATDVSPLRLDALLSGYFGTFGSMVGAMSTGVSNAFSTTPAPTKRIEQAPLIGRYVRDEPALATQWSQSWFQMVNDAQKVARGAKAFKDVGDSQAAAKLIESNPGAQWIAHHATGVSKQLAAMARDEQRIQADKKMEPDEKRKRIDALIARRNQIQRQAVEQSRLAIERRP